MLSLLASHLDKSAEAWEKILGKKSSNSAFTVFGRLEALVRTWAALQRRVLLPLDLNYAELATIGMLRTSSPDLRCSPTELRGLVGQTSAGMTRIINKLEKKEFVSRIEHPKDGRRIDIVLTPLGIKIAEESYIALAAVENALFGQLSTVKRDKLIYALDLLLTIFEEFRH